MCLYNIVYLFLVAHVFHTIPKFLMRGQISLFSLKEGNVNGNREESLFSVISQLFDLHSLEERSSTKNASNDKSNLNLNKKNINKEYINGKSTVF
jgi:hypothetical protein